MEGVLKIHTQVQVLLHSTTSKTTGVKNTQVKVQNSLIFPQNYSQTVTL